MRFISYLLCLIVTFYCCAAYKMLAIFPYNGRSHHIYFSSFVEELASRGHDLTVVNYFPLKKMANLRQISLQNNSTSDIVDIKDHLKNLPNSFVEFYSAYDTALAFKFMANTNCDKLMNNKELQEIIKTNTEFDVVIVEQFITDCGLALAHKIESPIVGMTAHILMPWTYSRLGATNHPVFVPNHFFGTGTKPNLLTTIKSAVINIFFNLYYSYVIQRSDYEIVKSVYPETPDLEEIGKTMSLILLNQYFPLTGSRLYGANVIEVGGMHIKQTNQLTDRNLETFLSTATNGVIYISFGSVAKNLPPTIINEITTFLRTSNKKILWKVDNINLNVPNNTLLSNWLSQQAILCHPNVVAFITHSGMLSSSEAMHCGVPLVSVPMFGDQFANAAAAVENGLGVTLDLATLDEKKLTKAINTVLQESYQKRAKQLSEIWRQRPLSPMDTAVFWTEYVAKYKGTVDLKPPTVNLPSYKYYMIDVLAVTLLIVVLTLYSILKSFRIIFRSIMIIIKKLGRKHKIN